MSSTAISAALKIPTKHGEVGDIVWRSPHNPTVIWRYWGNAFWIQTENPELGRRLKRLTGVERVSYSVGGGYQ